jgi:molybdopterin-guanine dinucleotide biosynthesis protein B
LSDVPGESLDNLVSYFDDVDLLITEGFKRDRAPKIEIYRAERHRHPACLEDDTLMAMVSDTPLEVTVPLFPVDAIEAIAEFIVENCCPVTRRRLIESRTDPSRRSAIDPIIDPVSG